MQTCARLLSSSLRRSAKAAHARKSRSTLPRQDREERGDEQNPHQLPLRDLRHVEPTPTVHPERRDDEPPRPLVRHCHQERHGVIPPPRRVQTDAAAIVQGTLPAIMSPTLKSRVQLSDVERPCQQRHQDGVDERGPYAPAPASGSDSTSFRVSSVTGHQRAGSGRRRPSSRRQGRLERRVRGVRLAPAERPPRARTPRRDQDRQPGQEPLAMNGGQES